MRNTFSIKRVMALTLLVFFVFAASQALMGLWRGDDAGLRNEAAYAEGEESAAEYTVTYQDTDGREYKTYTVAAGSFTPGLTVWKQGYTFTGWEPAVTERVTQDITYTATWIPDANGNGISDDLEEKFSVVFKSGNYIMQTYSLVKGAPTPRLTATMAGYTFDGWDPELSETVEGPATYEAKWIKDSEGGSGSGSAASYTVTFKDGSRVLYQGSYKEGSYTPQFTYSKGGYAFRGWSPAVAERVTSDATYTATWVRDANGNDIDDEEEEKYTVIYKDGDEVLREYTGLVAGVSTPVFRYSKAGYIFKGWSPEFQDKVAGNAVYIATWEEVSEPDPPRLFTVKYVDDDDEVIREFVCEEGSYTPRFTYSKGGYAFRGWSPAVAERVTSDATYKASWVKDANGNDIDDDDEDKYTVTYKDGDKVLREYPGLVAGASTPVFRYFKEGYTFKGWSPAFSEKVTGNTIYQATWEKNPEGSGSEGMHTIKYVVDGEVIRSYSQPKGAYTTKFSYTKGGYHFVRWDPAVSERVEGDATYTGIFVRDANGNGIDDATEKKYTVTYKDGSRVIREYTGLVNGASTPVLRYSKEGHEFLGWSPAFQEKVQGDTVYTAQFRRTDNEEYIIIVPDGSDTGSGSGSASGTGTAAGEGGSAKSGSGSSAESGSDAVITAKNAAKYIPAEISKETPAPEKAVTALITGTKNDGDLKGATVSKLLLMSPAQTKSSIALKWTKVSGATKYTVYGNLCGKGKKYRKIKSFSGRRLTVSKLLGKKIKNGKSYKFLVVAEKAGKVVALSKTIHVRAAGSRKYANFKKVSIPAITVKMAARLKAGKKLILRAKEVVPRGKKVLVHKKMIYESTNAKVAKVSKKGLVKAIGKGTCRIYCYSQSGVHKAVKVVVR